MNWENLEKILEMKDDDFEKEANKIQIIDSNARIEKFEAILKKSDLGMSTLIGSEITPKRHKLSAFVAILKKVRDAKEKERFNQNRQAREKWRDDTLKIMLHDMRIIYGTSADRLMHSLITMDVPDWLKVESLEFDIDGVSGHKIKIDLKKIVSPSTLEMLLAKSFSPIYLVVERSGGYDRHGKKLGYFQKDDWMESQGNEIRYGTTLAIMRV